MIFDWTVEVSDLVKLGGVVAGVFYAINSIRETTNQLKTAINHLTHAVEKLDGRTESNTKEIGNVRERVAVLESRVKAGFN